MDDITSEEKNIIDELRRRTINDVTPKMLEDISLFYRFAKARDFNLAEAEAMLRKHIVWRKEMQIDTILTDYEPPKVLVEYIPSTRICFDKVGSIVRFIDCGRTDVKGVWNVAKKSELTKYLAYETEQDKEFLMKKGRNLGKPMYCSIFDFEDLTYANVMSIKSLQYVLCLLRMFMDHYPETISRITVINAPSYFTWFYSAIKPILPTTVQQKIGIFGTDGWKEGLLELIDADGLPAYLGGTRTDPDGNPLCKTFIPRGRPIPKSYYMSRESKNWSLASDALKLTVKPFSKEEIYLEVKEEDSFLKWEFEIKNRDIDFSLLFKDENCKDFQPIVIISKQRIDSHDEPERGYFKCDKAGFYTIVFDNTYSWFYSKEVYYRAEIKSPKNDEIISMM